MISSYGNVRRRKEDPGSDYVTWIQEANTTTEKNKVELAGMIFQTRF